jgi:hypothetical protein
VKVLFKFLVILVISSLASASYAFPELPFCPAGGPPGWMNHFNHKHEQNIWRHYYRNNAPAYYYPAYAPGSTLWPPAGRPAYKPRDDDYHNYVMPQRMLHRRN